LVDKINTLTRVQVRRRQAPRVEAHVTSPRVTPTLGSALGWPKSCATLGEVIVAARRASADRNRVGTRTSTVSTSFLSRWPSCSPSRSPTSAAANLCGQSSARAAVMRRGHAAAPGPRCRFPCARAAGARHARRLTRQHVARGKLTA
jgi:hypothetical protein